MENHPVPRQITTFEFKLIGFLTLRQFIYLVIFFPLGVIVFYLFPIPFLNILFSVLPPAVGLALAFVPYNGRPLDVWVKNFFKKLFRPSQYYYIKRNQVPAFLKDVFITSNPETVQTHLEAHEKLSSYLAKKKTSQPKNQKNQIHRLISSPLPTNLKQTTKSPTPAQNQTMEATPGPKPPPTKTKKPFLFGIVKNNKNLPLPGALVYIKNEKGENVRILKANHRGVFATFHPFPPGDYLFEVKDLGNKFFFDKIKIKVLKENKKPVVFVSKELL